MGQYELEATVASGWYKVCSTNKSSPFRLNLGCSFCCQTNTMSPRNSIGRFIPASLGNVIFCPFCIPFSTITSKTFFSWTTFSTLHCRQRSLSLIASPVPLHFSKHAAFAES
ncbi:hypothetical protein CIPAW_13G166300 [Carya illinoinensis]|uniref:Uncharacterized protein n=1 Tax=Carya illinoinensis TaxID=32201 RepID=A0A8T1NQ71_CARIL|nr:hypothetical protein CIPAW_13G166300 [Carya illinoinensis]